MHHLIKWGGGGREEEEREILIFEVKVIPNHIQNKYLN
jgi:hypothetical protein